MIKGWEQSETILMILPTNHISFSAARLIYNLCRPLRNIGIIYFSYLKNFHDGTQINLSSSDEWLEYYYTKALYQSSLFERRPDTYQAGYVLWSSSFDNPLFQQPAFTEARKQFDSDHGITFIEPHSDHTAFYFFSAHKDSPAMLSFYINHLSLLHRFMVYFKSESSSILVKAHKKRIILPEGVRNELFQQTNNDSIQPILSKSSHKEFIQKTQINTFTMKNSHQQPITLSKREFDCAVLLVEKYTAQQVADTLHLSRRTVETHIDNLKTKLSCVTKAKLIALLKQQGLDRYQTQSAIAVI